MIDIVYYLGYLGYSAAMLFMIIEHFKDVAAIGDRFRAKGRMLPDNVSYQSSRVDPIGLRCFQLMEARTKNHCSRGWQLGVI